MSPTRTCSEILCSILSLRRTVSSCPSLTGGTADLAPEKQIIEKCGFWLNYKATQLARGRDAAKDTLKTDRKLCEEIEATVKARLEEVGARNSETTRL